MQADIARHVAERGWDQMPVRDTFVLMVEEVGELAKEIRKVSGLPIDTSISRDPNLDHELADVFIYLLALANALDIDLTSAFDSKRAEIEQRAWN